MGSGSGLRLGFLASPAIRVAAGRITAALSKRFFGLPAPARLGGICILNLGGGIRSFGAFAAGRRRVFSRSLFKALSDDNRISEYAMIDGTIVRVHQHGAGAKGGLKIRQSGDRAAV